MSVVAYSRSDAVAWLIINRADARNAVNSEVRNGLRAGFEQFAGDAEARVLVLASEGPVFCAGGDLAEMASLGTSVIPRDFVPSIRDVVGCNKPVIAAVQGAALGGGFWLSQECDLVIAADDARFAISEAKWGRGAPWAAPLLPLLGPRAALELMATAEPVDAYRAHELGLVNHVVPAEQLREHAASFAQHIASMAPLSVAASVEMTRAYRLQVAGQLADDAWKMWQPVYESEDAQEGPRAFAEKRSPVWRGR
jgi:enoyl-CoA hydratase/carnithine racemase